MTTHPFTYHWLSIFSVFSMTIYPSLTHDFKFSVFSTTTHLSLTTDFQFFCGFPWPSILHLPMTFKFSVFSTTTHLSLTPDFEVFCVFYDHTSFELFPCVVIFLLQLYVKLPDVIHLQSHSSPENRPKIKCELQGRANGNVFKVIYPMGTSFHDSLPGQIHPWFWGFQIARNGNTVEFYVSLLLFKTIVKSMEPYTCTCMHLWLERIMCVTLKGKIVISLQ